MIIGQMLRQARKDRGIKVESIAEQMDVAVPTVTRWENGSIDIPSSAMDKYISLLEMTKAEFFAEYDDSTVTTKAAHMSDGATELPPEAEEEIRQLMEYVRHKYGKKQ